MQAAVVMLIFKRPATTARVFDAIRLARPERLFVVADGPRADRPGEAEACLAARAATEGVDWPCRVERLYAEENLGCRRRVATGLNAVFDAVDRAVILEDDCLPDPTFFGFCEELLERYAGDGRVGAISGDNFAGTVGGIRAGPEGPSYHFTRYPHIWGWATWARAWRGFDPALPWWRGRAEFFRLRRRLGGVGAANFWYNWARQCRTGKLSSWAIPWTLHQWEHDRLTIGPERNLVSNIGNGEGATHTRDGENRFVGLPLESMRPPLRHPTHVQADPRVDEWTERNVFSAGRPMGWGDVRQLLLRP